MTIKAASQKVQLQDRIITPKTNLVTAVNDISADLKRLADAHDKHDDTLGAALKGGISSANNQLVQFKTVDIDLPADAPWFTVTEFFNSWVNYGSGYGPLQFLLEPGCHASMRGRVKSGISSFVAQLPDGMAPPYAQPFGANSGLFFGSFQIEETGAININLHPGASIDLIASWIASPGAFGLLPGRPFDFPAPHWPVIVNHGWDRCLGLVIESCFEATTGERATYGAPVPDWEDLGNGQVSLRAVWGLAWGRRYTLRLRLSAEKE